MQIKGTLKGAWFGSTKLYQSRCPPGRPNGAFYLKPLKKPKADVWFGCFPLGHNVLGNTIRRLFEHTEIPGFYMNHSAYNSCNQAF